jgi:hypothetical protein
MRAREVHVRLFSQQMGDMESTLKSGRIAREIAHVKHDVFGQHYQHNFTKTGYQFNKIQLKGRYDLQYYEDTDAGKMSIDKAARMASKAHPTAIPYRTDIHDRRTMKLIQLRRRGLGPAKKKKKGGGVAAAGSTAPSKKKK